MLEIRMPQGMRDLIEEECTKKRVAQETIEKVFQSFGYHQIMTPMIEYFETYQQSFLVLMQQKCISSLIMMEIF